MDATKQNAASQTDCSNGHTLTLPDLAAQIKAHHVACQEAEGVALARAMAAGDLFIQAKALCRHGE